MKNEYDYYTVMSERIIYFAMKYDPHNTFGSYETPKETKVFLQPIMNKEIRKKIQEFERICWSFLF